MPVRRPAYARTTLADRAALCVQRCCRDGATTEDGATARKAFSSEQRLDPGLRHFRWCGVVRGWAGQKAW